MCRDVCFDFKAELDEFNGKRDHVHRLVTWPPKVRLWERVNSLKGVSSRRLKVAPVEFPAISIFSSVRKRESAVVPELFRWFSWWHSP
jgi:putative transposase